MSVVDFVRGRLVERGPDWAVIGIGGIGLRVLVGSGTAAALPEAGEEATLYTHLQVREDALTLYGFATPAERALFDQLLTVSGVGPKVALAALSAHPAARLHALIAAGDAAALARIPGIGTKTAQRIVLDLKGKLPAVPSSPAAGHAPSETGGILETVAAALRDFGGLSGPEVADVLALLPAGADLSEEDALRLAFQHLGQRR